MVRRNRRRLSQNERRQRRASSARWLVWVPLRLVVVAIVVAGLGWGGKVLWGLFRSAEVLALRDIQLNGNLHTPASELLSTVGIQPGMNIFDVVPREVEKRLLENAWVRRAHVQRVVPDKIAIQIEEHTPVAKLVLESLYYVNPDGEIFKKVQPGETMDLPVLSGPSRDEVRAEPERVRQRLRLALVRLAQLQTQPCLRRYRVAEIEQDELLGSLVVLDPGAITVRLGESDPGMRLPVLCQLLDELVARKLSAHTIWLDNPERPGWAMVRPNG